MLMLSDRGSSPSLPRVAMNSGRNIPEPKAAFVGVDFATGV